MDEIENEIACSECEESNSVEFIENSQNKTHLICTECKATFENTVECYYCSHTHASDSLSYLEGSYLSGCTQCDGKDLTHI